MATKNEQEEGNKDYAEQFNKESTPGKTQTDDEAFGLGPEEPDAGAPGGDATSTAGEVAAPAAAEAPAAPSADEEKAKQLQEREDALNAREQELDGRAAAMQTSNTNEVQSSKPAEGGEHGKGEEGGEGSEDAPKDARAALAEDFGPEFVTLLEAFIKDVVKGSVTDEIGGLRSTVQSVIDGLTAERNEAHFKTIKAAHEDFMDIVESPEFQSWLDGLAEADKAVAQHAVDAGSSQQIIDMLTSFKASKAAAGGDQAAVDDSALDDAEGVRSVGISLPKEPKASEDYADAWNAA